MYAQQTNSYTSRVTVITALLVLTLFVIIALVMLRNRPHRLRAILVEDPERLCQDELRSFARRILKSIPVVAYRTRTTPYGVTGGTDEAWKLEADIKGQIVGDLDSHPSLATHPSVVTRGPNTLQPAIATRDRATESTTSSNDQSPSCSICTDEFEDGQNIRVLPCDHMYHVECIDNWILNFAGNCPLCRIDLRTRVLNGEGQSYPTIDDAHRRLGEQIAPLQRIRPHDRAGQRESARRSSRVTKIARVILGSRSIGVESSQQLELVRSARQTELRNSSSASVIVEQPQAAHILR